MRLVASTLAAAVSLVAGAGVARAIDLPPPPTVPTPTVPSVTVPLPAPTPPLPQAPAPVSTVTTQAQTAVSSVTQTVNTAADGTTGGSSTSAVTSTAGASGSGASGGGGSGGSAPSSPSVGSPAGGAAGPERVGDFHSSRGWIGTTGSKQRRTTTLTFVLTRAGRVIFTINQVSPQCAAVGHFAVNAHAGVNRLGFAGRLHGRRLEPGTYKLSVSTPSGRVVRRITLVIVDGPAPSREELAALRAANVCSLQAQQQASFVASGGQAANSGGGTPASATAAPTPLGVAASAAPHVTSGVLGSSIQDTARAVRPLLVALLALSILLLGAASLPSTAVPGLRAHDVLGRYRIEITAVGALALVAVAIAFLIG